MHDLGALLMGAVSEGAAAVRGLSQFKQLNSSRCGNGGGSANAQQSGGEKKRQCSHHHKYRCIHILIKYGF